MGVSQVDGTTGMARRDRQIWMALLLACVGVGLLGYVAGTWSNSGPARGVAAMMQSTQGESRRPSPAISGGISSPMVVLPVATFFLFSAVTLLLRSRHSGLDDVMRDSTTGLYNPTYMGELLPGLMARDDRAGISQLALVMLRVDFLDEIRDRYGSPTADRVMAALGRQIRSQIRACDVPVRLDGQGLAVFLQCGEVDQAEAFGRRLGTLLASEQLDLGGDVIKITASMGIAVRRPGESLQVLLARTTEKLELAADAGSDR